MESVLVSSCLLGEAVRYNGGDKRCDHHVLRRWMSEGRVVPVCPEVAGGLPVPRPPAEIVDGVGGLKVLAGDARVVDVNGRDVSAHFVQGAAQALALVRAHNIRIAVLKEGSPSCGSSFTYDGTFTATKVAHPGVTTALLQQAGVHVFSESQLEEADRWLKQFESARDKHHTSLSKFLSYVLRHRPDEVGIELDAQGWIGVDELLAACARHGKTITRAELEYVVAHNNKNRFALSNDGLRIRASQGHSIEVELGYEPSTPPELLYHGTARHNLASIREHGLLKGRRHQVHLSGDEATARIVGQRHGQAVVLRVRAGEMARAGFTFYLSANGVWLTDAVPYRFIDEPES